jgi:hypothetical protein
MSLSGHHTQSKHVHRDKRGREIKTECDFLAKRLRHSDGSYGTYRNGKLVAKEDVPPVESKFYKPTPVSTVIEKPADKETMGDKETAARVRKRFDVNASGMKL